MIFHWNFNNAVADSTASVVKKLKRNALLVGNENLLLVDTDNDGGRSDKGRAEEEGDEVVEARESMEQ